MRYFVVYLTDGNVMDFDKKCNSVNFFDKDEKVFQLKNDTRDGYYVLAIIPVENVLRIVAEEEEV